MAEGNNKEGSKLGRLRSAAKQQNGKLYIIKKCIAMLDLRRQPKSKMNTKGHQHY
ncbi:hypothetical protein PVAP13_3KG262777 [Panicum virgatum]|uniref:Uncharacterized protein n=1 Tax=Panicum virgatum TaxID=38727 RepID=A0A8T0V2Z2_PANVG|nr:hypothetical protein PVAP13_3KG262777 [Panicum virgatum]